MRRAVSRQLRTLAHGGSFGLSCVVSAICRARPLWPSAPRMGNWLPCHGGRPQGPRPARGSECTRRFLRSFVCCIGHLQGAALVAVRTQDGKLVTLQRRTCLSVICSSVVGLLRWKEYIKKHKKFLIFLINILDFIVLCKIRNNDRTIEYII